MSLDEVIAAIARRQAGVVARAQLLDAGLSPRQVAHRLRTGRLHRIHPGVYAVGHAALTPAGRRRAAVLACGVRERPPSRPDPHRRRLPDPPLTWQQITARPEQTVATLAATLAGYRPAP